MLKSGGRRLNATDKQIQIRGADVSIAAGDDLEGYETAFYTVEPHEAGGVRIEFAYAELMKGGEATRQAQPREPLFRLPPGMRFVRLIYATRASQADHDMAVVAADESIALDKLTRDVQARQTACKTDAHRFCSWIAVGTAVQPEMRTTSGGAEQWSPVR